MSAVAATGSPTLRRTATNRTASQEDSLLDGIEMNAKKTVATLSTNKLGNLPPKNIKANHDTSTNEVNPMDKLLAKLSEQKAVLHRQHEALRASEDVAYSRTIDYIVSTSASIPNTPPNEAYNTSTVPLMNATGISGDDKSAGQGDIERLRAELEAANSKIARMDQELAQSRITKHTLDQAMESASEADFTTLGQTEDRNGLPASLSFGYPRPNFVRDNSWQTQDDTRSDTSDALSASGFNRARAIWANGPKPTFGSFALPSETLPSQQWSRPFAQSFDNPMPYSAPPQITTFRAALGPERVLSESDFLMVPPAGRRGPNRHHNRNQPALQYGSSNSSVDGYTPSTLSGFDSGNSNCGTIGSNSGLSSAVGNTPRPHLSSGMYGGYPPLPIGTPLSPHAPEFTSNPGWKNESGASEIQTYLPTTEPLNYRRLLDRTANCDWKYIVDKIVCNNDQQASIFLQQKLKVGTTEQKYDIVEAIVAQAYPLMVNRFGNFLVQRCFEHGTPEQVIKIAEAIRGNTLNLSMDAFGCHVVQKAFDSVPEDYKAIMVNELLRRIPETVIHRYACHVWQKLFELRWTESPPQIMKYVNDALRGMWHEVALGETGSLVVQNIFENCLEDDKRPCIEEVLASIDIVAHGQFGNWCIQHICEHGAPADRSRAIDHVIRYASEYSMDQFASKVVEKCLKIGGIDFLSRYLDRVCEGRLDRPRIPLIDIASDQYGNYLIQYILTHSNPQHREIVAQHIRKHMVSLRGSKFGSRVGMLCTNPAIQTRPGPAVGPSMGPPASRMGAPPPPRYGGPYR